jgi:ABC-type branched-subunit amino acid transport system substrate-binding protein
MFGPKPLASLCATAATVLALSACGSSAGSGASGGSAGSPDTGTDSLTFAAFNTFSGPNATFGPEQLAGCGPAAQAIQAAGGILKHKSVSCNPSDSRGDPADAVPAAQQLIASTGHLVGVLGPGSDEAPATIPLFNRSHIPMFSDAGQGLFDKSTFKYFWRILPADDQVGYAMAVYAHQMGYTRVASVFGTSIGSQGSAPTVSSGFKKLGGTITTAQVLALGQPSYRSEVAQVAAGHPQAIFIELDPQSAATYLSELAQLYHQIPIIGTDGTTQPPWLKAVSGAIGKATVQKYYVGAQPYAPTGGAPHKLWLAQLHAATSGVAKPVSQWESDSYSEAAWDAVNIMGLAMEMSKSTNPTVFNTYITKVTNPGAGHVIVQDFAQGKQAILAGKPITYVGATGPITFDQYQNSPGGFEVIKSDATTVKTYTAADLQSAK